MCQNLWVPTVRVDNRLCNIIVLSLFDTFVANLRANVQTPLFIYRAVSANLRFNHECIKQFLKIQQVLYYIMWKNWIIRRRQASRTQL